MLTGLPGDMTNFELRQCAEVHGEVSYVIVINPKMGGTIGLLKYKMRKARLRAIRFFGGKYFTGENETVKCYKERCWESVPGL